MTATEPTQGTCDRCYRVHLLADLIRHDDDLLCPDCRGHVSLVIAPGDPSELARLHAIEAAAQAWHRAHRAEQAALQQDSPYRRDRLLPPGEPGIALVRLAALLADA
jgi:hypothetical protein